MVCFESSQVPPQLRRRPLHIVNVDVPLHSIYVISVLCIQPLHDKHVVAAKLRNRQLEVLLVWKVPKDLFEWHLLLYRSLNILERV